MPTVRTRSKYDTFVVYLYHLNKEHLLPEVFRKSIPVSTINSWRNTTPESYAGYEFSNMQEDFLEHLELYTKHRQLKSTVNILTKTWISVSDIITPFLNKHKQYKDKVINEVQRLCTVLPKRTALKLAGLTANAFHYRLNKLKFLCHDSVWASCLRRHPLQLSFKEINIMKSLLFDHRFVCWPVSSIAWFAQRNNLLGAALSTWYKYAPAMGFRKKLKPEKEVHIGLTTTAPNQFLHVDTTFWNIEHDVKAAIVFVSDNFSKAILGWNITLHKNAANVKCALDKAIQTIHQFHPAHLCSMLLADGGKENHNTTIHELLAATANPCITKIIAQKDIAFSNAPIESLNKIMKVYLRHYKPHTLPLLIECIRLAVHDYCFVRPHGSLNGSTPMEVYTNQHLTLDTQAYMMNAKAERIEQNSKHSCGVCK